MSPIASDLNREATRRGILATFGVISASGCTGYEYVSSDRFHEDDNRRVSPTRQRIIELYEDGQRFRNVASERWHRGSESWERQFYVPAARAFSRAGQYFNRAERQFRAARDACDEAGFTDATATCEGARRYCESMEMAAVSYSDAADSYATGDFVAGDRHLDRGWRQYSTAIDHDIPPSSELRNVLGG